MNQNTFNVLMVEDNEHDIVAAQRAWKRSNIVNPLYIVRDGEECLDYLFRRGKYGETGSAPEPGIILLDLKMPKLGGLKVLEQIRRNEKLRLIPVIILTTSNNDQDRKEGYDLGANAYIVKPVTLDKFIETISTINLFWELVKLP